MNKEDNDMEAVFDFFRAALPWIGMGLLLAVYFSGSVKNKEDQSENYGTEGMCLGMCFGTAIGTALGNNIAIGLPPWYVARYGHRQQHQKRGTGQ